MIGMIGIILLLLLVFTLPGAQAQLGDPQTVLSSNLAASSVAVTQGVSSVGSGNLLFVITALGSDAGVTNDGTLTLQKSIDGTTWVSGATLKVTPTGTSTANITTNLGTAGFPYWRLITADNSANPTNLTLTIKATKDVTSTTSLGTSVKVNGTSYTPSAVSIAPGANTGTAAFLNGATLTVNQATLTLTLEKNGDGVVTNATLNITTIATNASLATTTANAVTNAVGTASTLLKLTP